MIRILLVEDDHTIAMGLVYSLGQEGYAVTVAHDVAAAMEAITAAGPAFDRGKDSAVRPVFDLALIDVMLPDGNGYDVCRAIKARADTPVVFLTACDEEVNVVMGLDMGADDYIAKPFRLRELQSRIRTVLRRSGAAAGLSSATTPVKDELHLGAITIHVRSARVSRGDEDIPLTALEYRLLLAFASNPGRVLTRNQLLEGLWDSAGNYVNDNTVTVYIKRLREKLGDDPQHPVMIQTVRGIGYRAEDIREPAAQ